MNTIRITFTILCALAVWHILDMQVQAQNDPQPTVELELADSMRELEVLTHKLGLAIDAGNPKLSEFYHRESFYKSLEIIKLFPVYEGDPVAELLSSNLLDSYYNIKDGLDAEPTDFEVLNNEYKTLIDRCNVCHAATNRAYLKVKRNHSNPYLIDFAAPPPSEK